MNRYTVVFFLLLGISLPALGQEHDTVYAIQNADSARVAAPDTIQPISQEDFQVSDSVVQEVKAPKSPSRALMYALVLPGLGQAYNEKYYKIPIVWAALGAAGYAIVFNTNNYRDATYIYLQDPSAQNENSLQYWRRNMELSYIAAILVYGLQVLDAYVDANLYSWDVNENLSLGITPSLQPLMVPTPYTGISGGLTCSFTMKGR